MKKIDELLTIIYSYRKAQLLYIAAKLKIADILSDGPKNYVEIAKKTGTHAETILECLGHWQVLDL